MKTKNIIHNKYHVLEVLSESSISKVYLIEHGNLKTKRVMKQLDKSSPYCKQFMKEAFLMKQLDHPCIPHIFDYEEDEQFIYIIEQYMEGETLYSYFKNGNKHKEQIILSILLQICDLIQYLHSQKPPILHLDIKPDNIILSFSALKPLNSMENPTVKLIDFGCATQENNEQWSGARFGTPSYSAPELYWPEHPDERTDIYSIGKLIEFLLEVGEYSIEEARSRKGIKTRKAINEISKRCLMLNPEQRFQAVSQLKQQFQKLQKNSNDNKDKKCVISYAVAGAESNLGMTHIALLLCRYLTGFGEMHYVECNPSGAVRAMTQSYHRLKIYGEGYIVAGLKMYPNGSMPNCETDRRVIDYGVLNDENLFEFSQADMQILILASKEWELAKTEDAIDKVAQIPGVIFLFSFADTKTYHTLVKNMGKRRCFQIPYTGHPLDIKLSREVMAFFNEMLQI